MSVRLSFTHFEHELLPRFRTRLNGSRRVAEMHQLLNDTVRALLRHAVGDRFEVGNDCIQFTPASDPPYRLSPTLVASRDFELLWLGSDLPRIVGQLAADVLGRYQRLCWGAATHGIQDRGAEAKAEHAADASLNDGCGDWPEQGAPLGGISPQRARA